MSKELIEAITEMREGDAVNITNKLLDSGTDPVQVLDACREAMTIIGKRFETGDCFIPELILGSDKHCLNYIRASRKGLFDKPE
jgi:methanogenic corrinoid protein MtbC1